jgi:hypothetical protein
MRIERMGQANLAVQKLGKVAVSESGSGEVAEKPVVDMGTGGLDRVEGPDEPSGGGPSLRGQRIRGHQMAGAP